MEIEVKGHSGCSIDIVREEKELFIYKSTQNQKYIVRLLKQADKQKKAGTLEYQHIRIPQVFDIEQTKDAAFIKMEYVYSKNFIEYFETAGHEQIYYFIKALCLFIEKELVQCSESIIDGKVLINKMDDVKKNVLSNPLLVNDPIVVDMICQSQKVFNKLVESGPIKLPLGICHGDLTFSNILFNGNNYYLIDFLDSFIESPLLDVVKIRQDSAYCWSQLMYTKSYDRLRLKIISAKIDSLIDDYFQKYDWYKSYYKHFQLMNMLRILQYAKEENVVLYLKSVLKEVLNEF